VFYTTIGAQAWVALCVGAGWLFGNVPIVKDNFSLVAIGIDFVSLLPMAFEYLRHRRATP
jgi:membrane-associated protein